MPKKVRNKDEVISVKERIIREALGLILDDGFVHFSMRRLASRLGMTATNIYNYFRSKDDLYLHIQTRGFEMLHEALHGAYLSGNTPVEKIEGIIRAYLKFGMESPDYYEIMFSRNTPKYIDYIGTDMESVAFQEKQTALKSAEISMKAVTEVFHAHKAISPDDARFRMLHVWSTLNGIVNLFNSRVLQEVEEHASTAIERMVEGLVQSLRQELGEQTR